MESAIKDKSSGGALPPTDKEFDLLLADGDDFVDLDLEALANIIADCPAGSSDLITTDDDLFNPSAAISKAAVPAVVEIAAAVGAPPSADDTKAIKRERRRRAIERWKAKRKRRTWKRGPMHQTRTAAAGARQRVNGRFVASTSGFFSATEFV